MPADLVTISVEEVAENIEVRVGDDNSPVPDGGAIGEFLAKRTLANQDLEWIPSTDLKYDKDTNSIFVRRPVVGDFLDFRQNPTVTMQNRRIAWDEANGTLQIGLPGGRVALQVGREIQFPCRNLESSTLPKGTAVYVSNAASQIPGVLKASNAAWNTTFQMIGITTEEMAAAAAGSMTMYGIVTGLDTSGFTEGQNAYLGANGLLTSTIPIYPANVSVVAICLYSHASQGKILVNPKILFRKFGDITGGNFSGFGDDGTFIMNGSARTWRDELGDALGLRSQGPGVSLNLTELTQEFATNSDLNDYLYKNLQTNHDRDPLERIYPHIHFFQDRNSIPNFLFEYRWQINGGTKTTAWTRLKCNNLAFPYTSGTLHQIAATAAGILPPPGSTLSDIIQFRVLRDNSNASGLFSGADPYNAAVGVLSFDVHICSNTIGSNDQYTK